MTRRKSSVQYSYSIIGLDAASTHHELSLWVEPSDLEGCLFRNEVVISKIKKKIYFEVTLS